MGPDQNKFDFGCQFLMVVIDAHHIPRGSKVGPPPSVLLSWLQFSVHSTRSSGGARCNAALAKPAPSSWERMSKPRPRWLSPHNQRTCRHVRVCQVMKLFTRYFTKQAIFEPENMRNTCYSWYSPAWMILIDSLITWCFRFAGFISNRWVSNKTCPCWDGTMECPTGSHSLRNFGRDSGLEFRAREGSLAG